MVKTISESTHIPFTMHPRLFAAIGADLVTNDVVALIELVKNAYDAYATHVKVQFGTDSEKEQYLEIEDNGCGMGRATIEEVWCKVATPFRVDNPLSKKGKRIRRAAGEKGLGRFSAARLGSRLEMITKALDEPYWEVSVDWSDLSSRNDIRSCYASIRQLDENITFRNTGTRVRVLGLKSVWDEEKVEDLISNLSRLVSPFANIDDFKIVLTPPGREGRPVTAEISAPEFLSKPKYAIRGHVEVDGTVHGKYEYSPIVRGKPRSVHITLVWDQITKASDELPKLKDCGPGCGPFEFEIRAWDIGSEDTQQISESFRENRSQIRRAIKAHKGISVYRDGILVLPKSEDTRDWLGLDLRRISKVGTRLSTSQIVGYVSVSAEGNPNLKDKSDREGFANNVAVTGFQGLLKAIVSQLENERNRDRLEPSDEERLSDLFEDLTADDVLAELTAIADEGAPASDAIPMFNEFNRKLNFAQRNIKKRFAYYSRLATVGTIAQMLIHEIRSRTTTIGSFVRYVSDKAKSVFDKLLPSKIKRATTAVESLEQLADTFAPLASRSFKPRRRDSVLEESIQRCLSFAVNDIKELGIDLLVPRSLTRIAVDPGELDAIILNLITNSIYWLRQIKIERKLEFRVSQIDQRQRVKLSVDDSGPGVPREDAKKIFLPGVTRKPGGIGMGLTVAAELVAEYGGQMYLSQPGKLGGASFTFDVPVKR